MGMIRSKTFQLFVVLAALGGLFVLFLLSDCSFWVPTWVAVGALLIILVAVIGWLGWIFHSKRKTGAGADPLLQYPTKLEYSVMIALVMVICLTAVTAETALSGPQPLWPPWLLLPVWSIPALLIILAVFFSGLVLGLHREEGKVKFRWMKHKLEVGCGLGFLGLTIFLLGRWFYREVSYPLSFDGRSEALQRTVVVPTLDTPIPEGKSAIWCGSFQIAWNQLRSLANNEPLRIQGAEAVAERLNQPEESEDDLEPDMYYAAAGLVSDGIAQKIKKEMARKYPSVSVPEAVDSKGAAVAYSHLQAQVKFKEPYFENPTGGELDPHFFAFEDEQGNRDPVVFFGIMGYVEAPKIRAQAEVQYAVEAKNTFDLSEFAVDLSKESSPNQLVLAYIPRQGTLAETLDDLKKKIEQKPSESVSAKLKHHQLTYGDSLLVPTMHWRILHHFHELEGVDKLILNTGPLSGTYLGEAFQTLEFKLDRSGATIRSDSMLFAFSAPWVLHYNRPFLLYMKKRGAKHPFFVMWVDNAELLIKN